MTDKSGKKSPSQRQNDQQKIIQKSRIIGDSFPKGSGKTTEIFEARPLKPIKPKK